MVPTSTKFPTHFQGNTCTMDHMDTQEEMGLEDIILMLDGATKVYWIRKDDVGYWVDTEEFTAFGTDLRGALKLALLNLSPQSVN